MKLQCLDKVASWPHVCLLVCCCSPIRSSVRSFVLSFVLSFVRLRCRSYLAPLARHRPSPSLSWPFVFVVGGLCCTTLFRAPPTPTSNVCDFRTVVFSGRFFVVVGRFSARKFVVVSSILLANHHSLHHKLACEPFVHHPSVVRRLPSVGDVVWSACLTDTVTGISVLPGSCCCCCSVFVTACAKTPCRCFTTFSRR